MKQYSNWSKVIAVVAFTLSLCFLAYYFFFTAPVHTWLAERTFHREFSGLNQKMDSYGFVDSPVGFPRGCSDKYMDENVRVACSFNDRERRQIDEQLLNGWPGYAGEIESYLQDRKWKLQPNHDAVTENPVDTLPRLLEWKGVYSANVEYTKGGCTLSFEVVEDMANPYISVYERCTSTSI
jgi:hypothetical protein